MSRLREIVASFAWLLHPLQTYDTAHEIEDESPEPLAAEHRVGCRLWRIEAHDDQVIAEGRKYAAYRRVVLLRDGKQVREFLYPSYRIWTLLAHWTEGLADITDEEETNA